jgi:hypothetical protein
LYITSSLIILIDTLLEQGLGRESCVWSAEDVASFDLASNNKIIKLYGCGTKATVMMRSKQEYHLLQNHIGYFSLSTLLNAKFFIFVGCSKEEMVDMDLMKALTQGRSSHSFVLAPMASVGEIHKIGVPTTFIGYENHDQLSDVLRMMASYVKVLRDIQTPQQDNETKEV